MIRRPVFPSDFRALFRALSRSAVASTFAAAGCAASHEHDRSPHEQDPSSRLWSPLICDRADNWPLDDATLERPVDYLGLYNAYRDDADPSREQVYETERMYGELCDEAPDRKACDRAAELRQQEGICNDESCPTFLLATAGNEVTRIEDRAGLRALLGPIDTKVDAAIAAALAGGHVVCSMPSEDPDGTVATQIRATDEGYELETVSGCDGNVALTVVEPSGEVPIASGPLGCAGRRAEGLLPALRCHAASELGGHFAHAAHLEAASVLAFEQLARDLERLGAPSELVAWSLRAALEEVGHARAVAALAQRFGGERVAARVIAPPDRTALAIAIENATEGCVRETFGALIAWHQAQAALDPQVRQVMAQLAEDETRHAELSWRIASWLEPLLSETDQRIVHAARRTAFARVEAELRPELSSEAMRILGLPSEPIASALLRQLGIAFALHA